MSHPFSNSTDPALELSPAEFSRAESVLQTLRHHLAVTGILAGTVPARLIVDHPTHPRTVLAWTQHRFYLTGSPENHAFNQALGRLFSDTIYPQALAAGDAMFMLYYAPDTWRNPVEDTILRDKLPTELWRQYYRLKEKRVDWRAMLPEGFELRPVDPALLENTQLRHLDALREETCSERPSVQDFLEKSFGVCIVHGDELAGWCLSEYNTPDSCEIGIETREPYRRRGFATLMTTALVEEAQARGIAHVGWHCWASNKPSAKTALKAGFELVADYPVYMAWFDEVVNLAAHGNWSQHDPQSQ